MAITTITTTPAQDSRLIVAFGARLGLRDANGTNRNATAAEIKADLIQYLTNVVLDEERRAARIAAESGVTAITPL